VEKWKSRLKVLPAVWLAFSQLSHFTRRSAEARLMPDDVNRDFTAYPGRSARFDVHGGRGRGENFAGRDVFSPVAAASVDRCGREQLLTGGTGFATPPGELGGLYKCDALDGWSSLPQLSLHFSRCQDARP
jgi:hypothetical protein